ncbi:hypothetical protein HWI79_968 [Cryptosporidium felis]|nr:hypothetical protein HWI79_968 [Cryptosporidium felis]
MRSISELGYLHLDEKTLLDFEKEEKLDISHETLIDSQYIYFNSTNYDELLIYNKLCNSLLKINRHFVCEFNLPKLYLDEFSTKPEFLILYLNNKIGDRNYSRKQPESYCFGNSYLAYVQKENINSDKKLLVFRKIKITQSNIHEEGYSFDDRFGKENRDIFYSWNEIDYIETKINFETDRLLRGIVWWEESNDINNSLTSSEYETCPSIVVVTDTRFILYSIKDNGIYPVWQIVENNLEFWYNMEFQCILLQTKPNVLVPFINIGMNQEQRPVKLHSLELAIESNLQFKDIFLLNIYKNLYCAHLDYSNKRISLRDLFNQSSFDLVLDIGEQFQDFTLVLVEDIIIVMNLHDKKIFGLYDIKLLEKRKQGPVNPGNSNIDSTLSSCNYYIVPSIFSDKFKDNTVVCLYNQIEDNLNAYKKSIKKIGDHLNNFNILLLNSSLNVVIKLDFNKIQYSKLNLSVDKLIENIIGTKSNPCNVNIERLDLIPFIFNRGPIWGQVLLGKLEVLINHGKEDSNNQKETFSKLLTLLLEIIKVKLDLKAKIENDYYWMVLDLILFCKKEPLLQYVLQYHIIEDSDMILNELYKLYLFNRDSVQMPQDSRTKPDIHVRFEDNYLDSASELKELKIANKSLQYFKLNNKVWLEQFCLDSSHRLGNINILVSILINRKEYRRVIELLRDRSRQRVIINVNNREISIKKIILTLSNNNKACKYPIYNLLYEIGTNVQDQRDDPNLLKDVIEEIQSWVSCYINQVDQLSDLISCLRTDDSNVKKHNIIITGKPNLKKCDIWLPELIGLKDLSNEDILDSHFDDLNPNVNSNSRVENKTNQSTFESIYVSATESNETFITTNNKNQGSVENREIKDDDTSANAKIGGKSPLLQHEPGIISSKNLLYIENSDSSSSFSSDSSSSFNSYEDPSY